MGGHVAHALWLPASRLGAKTAQNSAPVMIAGNEWPTYVDNEFSIKQKLMETLIAALDSDNLLGSNGRYSDIRVAVGII